MCRAGWQGMDEAVNRKEALHALVEGKKVKHSSWDDGLFLEMKDSGLIVTQTGGLCDLAFENDWSIAEPANDHTPGTFAWAREEAKRGRQVRRRVAEVVFTAEDFAKAPAWSLDHIDATDWEVV